MRHHLRRVILNLVVLAVAAHSIIVGTALLLFPMRTLGVLGWQYAGQVFWPSQAGLFLAILGSAYAVAIRLPAFAWLVIGSKASAFVFLLVSVVWLDAPRIVVLLACGDGAMALAVAIAFWLFKRADSSPVCLDTGIC